MSQVKPDQSIGYDVKVTSLSPVSDTTPGQSIRKIRFIRAIYCHTFVSPGIGAALQHFLPIKELITLDLPVFGYPMTPTDICRLSYKQISRKIYKINKIVNAVLCSE